MIHRFYLAVGLLILDSLVSFYTYIEQMKVGRENRYRNRKDERKRKQKKQGKKNIQHRVFAGRHRPNY